MIILKIFRNSVIYSYMRRFIHIFGFVFGFILCISVLEGAIKAVEDCSVGETCLCVVNKTKFDVYITDVEQLSTWGEGAARARRTTNPNEFQPLKAGDTDCGY